MVLITFVDRVLISNKSKTANERIARLEEEHKQMEDPKQIHTQRADIKEKIRLLDQDVERLHVRLFPFPALLATF
jgi:hypothetical protein